VIAQVSVLAVLMPIVASMSGTTGNQTLAVVVRALATKEITSANTLRMIFKEFLVGVMNGALFAGLIALVVSVWFPDKIMVSYIIAVAMALTLIIASLSGILIPLTLNKFKIDPAISSGVFLIAITDSFGFFIFLGLAKLLLFK
jgi:magnesium transporter